MKHILVVEDGLTMRLFYRDVLEAAGFQVDEAANGVEGLERAMLQPFDLAIVDVNMPKMDGFEMIRRMRQHPDLSSLPVATISTEAGESDMARAYAAGANYYLVKPAPPGDLALVARLLTGERL
ncbi:MAG: response regulator [Ancalomicrobiaceae bacterium]|nr:response regulator [Ancalomicrobiaceae bacterium]